MTSIAAFTTPDWVKDAVFYQIFPDRFAQSPSLPRPSNLEPWDSPPTLNGFKGGDLLGVAEHLDYLRDLGITAIYFCPVFKSTANHRYHTYDYFEIDPILGGNAALKTLLDEAHARDIRVVLDGVFNHASRGFYQFNHLLENGQQSPYLDWFHVDSWPLHPYGPGDQPPGYAAWWGMPALPKFNTQTQAVREFLWEVGEHWIRQGVDGWRLDVPNEIDDDAFWREFRRRVKAANPEAYIVGEIWGDARRWLAGDQFDAVMNYLFTRACVGFFAGSGAGINQDCIRDTGLNEIAPVDAAGFRDTINGLLALYPQQATEAQLNLIDSHDTPRFLTIAKQDEAALRLAFLFQMTFVGAPCVYYGDEVGMEGGHDPDCRRAFRWDESTWNMPLREYVKSAIALRHRLTVLRRGEYQSLHAEDGVYVFARCHEREIAVAAFNTSYDVRTISPEIPTGTTQLDSAFGTSTFTFDGNGLRDWQIPARSGSVLVGRTSV